MLTALSALIHRPTPEEVLKWADSLDALLSHKCKISILSDVVQFIHIHFCAWKFMPNLVFSLCPSDGQVVFRFFLQTEFSEENLDFWLACEDFKRIKSLSKMASRAKKIFTEYISIQSCKEVSLNTICSQIL